MADYKYIIVGGGMTGYAAAQGVRRHDPDGALALFSLEADPPYRRPPLTKGLWKGAPMSKVLYDAAPLNASLHLATEVQSIDRARHAVLDGAGEEHSYEKLLLATGGTPRRLPYGGGDIIYYRTLEDYRRVRALADRRASFAIIGGGFIGSELAASLASNGCHVTMVFPEDKLGVRNYPADLAEFLTGYFGEKGVDVRPSTTIKDFRREGARLVLEVETAGAPGVVEAEAVIAGIGIAPNIALAEAAGLETANGIVVDDNLRTSDPDIYAAGDVAAFDNDVLGPRVRVEHEDNARTMGRAAGENMAGAARRYEHTPFFYSDLFDLGYEAVGMLDARLQTFSDWQEPYRKGVVYYTQDGRVRGVLLWNVWEKVDAARELLMSGQRFSEDDLRGRLTADAK
jgi:3-phenylpropionate/trans-cinnamate dioxygenase ferredoxin reductase subunit